MNQNEQEKTLCKLVSRPQLNCFLEIRNGCPHIIDQTGFVVQSLHFQDITAQFFFQANQDRPLGLSIKSTYFEQTIIFQNFLETISGAKILSKYVNFKGFKKIYTFIKKIGKGNYSRVYKVRNNLTGQQYAVKVIRKDELDETSLQQIFAQVKILRQLDHPNLIKLHYVYQSVTSLYLITDLFQGKTLQNAIISRGALCIAQVKQVIRGLLLAVNQLQNIGIVHCDIKPENIMLMDGSPILCDFGLAFNLEKKPKNIQGTPGFIAPEVIASKNFQKSNDLFSIGCVMYTILSGHRPFNGKTINEVLQATLLPIPNFNQKTNKFSAPTKHLLQKLLEKNPQKRLTITQAIQHQFVSTQLYVQKIQNKYDIRRVNSIKLKEELSLASTQNSRPQSPVDIGSSIFKLPKIRMQTNKSSIIKGDGHMVISKSSVRFLIRRCMS